MGGAQSSEEALVATAVESSVNDSKINRENGHANGALNGLNGRDKNSNGFHQESQEDSNASATNNVGEADTETKIDTSAEKSSSSLRDRGQIPLSAYVCWSLIFGLQYTSKMYSMSFLHSWWRSVTLASHEFYQYFAYIRNVCQTLCDSSTRNTISSREMIWALGSVLLVASLLTILFIAPLRAGFWTGKRATSKHVFHRYAGLAYLIQYGLAWIEYLTLYETSARTSFLPHTIAINGKSTMVLGPSLNLRGIDSR
jgi:hypothetical protein